MNFAALALAVATLASPQLGEIKLSTGVRLQYAEQGPANAPVIIALPGYSDSWFSYSSVMPLLADKYKVYALSLRGHGDSDRPAKGYSMRDLATDVVAFMEAKRIRRATIIGHSMGGLVAQQVALIAPEKIDRLVLVATATRIQSFEQMDGLWEAVATLTEPVPADFAREFQSSTIYHPVEPAFLNQVVNESLKLPVFVWRELMKGMLETKEATALGRMGIPTLLIRGEHDPFASQSAQNELLRMLKSAELKIYRETGHAVHWERPQWFAKDVREFIEGRI